MHEIRQRMRDDLRLRNYSPKTENVYLYHLERFERFSGRSPALLNEEDIRRYLLHLRNDLACSWSWWKQAVAMLRFLYGITLQREVSSRGSRTPAAASACRWYSPLRKWSASYAMSAT